MKNIIIDSHCHVYPKLSSLVFDVCDKLPINSQLPTDLVRYLENKSTPIKQILQSIFLNKLNYVHDLAHSTRKLPLNYIDLADRIQSILWASGLVLEGKCKDLERQMDKNHVDFSVIIAHPPVIPNDFIIHLANNSSKYIPIVNLQPCKSSKEALRNYIRLGAKGLKIHAASDGLDAFDEHYLNLLEVAHEHHLPVIIHTGQLNIYPVYKDPDMGHAEHFESWFVNYPNVKFILAHMNIHFPQVAIDLCNEYENVYTDTSWQPKEAIINAVKSIGADKLMFGTDWPIIGNNISYGLKLINELRESKQISKAEEKKILGLTAANIFNISQ